MNKEILEICLLAALIVVAMLGAVGALSVVSADLGARECERRAMRECMDAGARWDDCRLWVGAEMERKR